MNVAAEIEFVKTFVIKKKQERYVYLVQSSKRRKTFLREPFHFRDFDPAYNVPYSGNAFSAQYLITELRKRGAADDCLIISVRRDLDGTTMPLPDTIHEVLGRVEGTIVLCAPGKLAYYEGEPPYNQCILYRGGHRT
jgi:hypothetical protein